MSIETTGSVFPRGSRRVRWAGRLLLLVAAGHGVGALVLTAQHLGSWFGAVLWRPQEGVVDMSPAMAGFWLTTGSFAAPMVVVGATVLWLDQHGLAPPRFTGWILGAWSLVAAAILEPAPWVLVTVAAGLLLAASRPATSGQSSQVRPWRLTTDQHSSRPWLIHEVAADFVVEDVWLLQTPGDATRLPDLVCALADTDFPQDAPALVRLLWRARWRIGAVLGWDREDAGIGARVGSLRERLPDVLRRGPRGSQIGEPFATVYELDDEFAAEMANRTVHTVLHLGWVEDDGGYRGQMAVLVRPNGWPGRVYMAAIRPLRRAFVDPALVRGIERRWCSTRPGKADQGTIGLI